MKDRKKNRIDENFFNQMTYEIAAEHGIIDDEDMKKNKKIINWNKKDEKDGKKP